MPQGTEGQQGKSPAGSKGTTETKSGKTWSLEEREAWRASAFQMPTRGGAQAPTRREGGINALIKPGQLDGSRPDPSTEEPDKDGTQEWVTGPSDPWEKYKKPAASNGPTRPVQQGYPEGGEQIAGSHMWRTPASDFMYHIGWKPPGEEARIQGRHFLTNASEHAKQVHADQMESRKLFLCLLYTSPSPRD